MWLHADGRTDGPEVRIVGFLGQHLQEILVLVFRRAQRRRGLPCPAWRWTAPADWGGGYPWPGEHRGRTAEGSRGHPDLKKRFDEVFPVEIHFQSTPEVAARAFRGAHQHAESRPAQVLRGDETAVLLVVEVGVEVVAGGRVRCGLDGSGRSRLD